MSGIDRCKETSNRVVRDDLRFVHPSPESVGVLLSGWRQQPVGTIRDVLPCIADESIRTPWPGERYRISTAPSS